MSSLLEVSSSFSLSYWQTRTHCCGHIVADTNVSPFARARNICCGHKFCARDTKNVSDSVQKHFVSAANVSQFAQPKKHHEQQCVRNNVSSFASTLDVTDSCSWNTIKFCSLKPGIRFCTLYNLNWAKYIGLKSTYSPSFSSAFVHRCGRTARIGNQGKFNVNITHTT